MKSASKSLIQPEMCFAEIKCQFAKVVVGVIYKSPLISYTEYSVLTEVLPPIITGYDHHIIMGDFNVNQLKPDSSACKFFREHVLQACVRRALAEQVLPSKQCIVSNFPFTIR